MLEQASALKKAGLLDIADQIVVEYERLLGVITAVRELNIQDVTLPTRCEYTH